jgi:hypothetical protein
VTLVGALFAEASGENQDGSTALRWLPAMGEGENAMAGLSSSAGFTPYGYLRNPFAVARSWGDGDGGGLRSTREQPGFGWEYPWPRSPIAGAGLELGCRLGERSWQSRAEFADLGYHSACHSCLVFSYDWSLPGMEVHARFLLAERDVVLCIVDWEPAGVSGNLDALSPHPAQLQIRLRGSDGGWHRGAGLPG